MLLLLFIHDTVTVAAVAGNPVRLFNKFSEITKPTPCQPTLLLRIMSPVTVSQPIYLLHFRKSVKLIRGEPWRMMGT